LQETIPDMDRIFERAAQWGIETQYVDGLGRRRVVEPQALARILDIMTAGGELPPPPPPDATPRAAPPLAYQGAAAAPWRSWVLAVQLYGVRSRRNWGHGDFTDLARLIDLAAALGASGVGLNPLHALFDDRAEEASPYFPNSRFFLNPLYIDVEALPEFAGLAADGFGPDFAALRTPDLVDYGAVAKAKMRALSLVHDAFRRQGSRTRQRQFERFRRARGASLAQFAAFELLRRRYGRPWWEWPEEFRRPNAGALARLRAADANALAQFEFAQWIADQQLAACRDHARKLGLSVGLYLDIAVGVRADGFDAWSDQDFILPGIEIGAPPDLLNTQGQRWGLAGFNPVDLINRDCAPFRRVLAASMRYAGAVRLDHVLGLKRLYLVPRDMRADQGAYIRFPFEALLAAIAHESVANRCIVIGEDLGTVPENFRATLAAAGLWSYQVMLFERAADGGFISPDLYRENALVTFATHDLPTFAGWAGGHDLTVKRTLGLDPGESDRDRAAAKEALGRAMAWRGLAVLDFPAVAKFLADTPSRLLVVSMEDALGEVEQVNVPGTIDEHPNWRRRLPVDLEDLPRHDGLSALAKVMAAAGR
jgi:4-alpha-glucanotransferase